jgi:hypothetical protein
MAGKSRRRRVTIVWVPPSGFLSSVTGGVSKRPAAAAAPFGAVDPIVHSGGER